MALTHAVHLMHTCNGALRHLSHLRSETRKIPIIVSHQSHQHHISRGDEAKRVIGRVLSTFPITQRGNKIQISKPHISVTYSHTVSAQEVLFIGRKCVRHEIKHQTVNTIYCFCKSLTHDRLHLCLE